MKIAFFWFGFDGRHKYHWQDGLYAALKVLEENNEVRYYDVNDKTLQEVREFKPDVVLFWEAPVTQRGKDAHMWFGVCSLPYPKALLFAGGPLKAMEVKDFDLVFVESLINEEDCEREGIPYKRAFGVNTQIMKPQSQEKVYDAFLQATFAGWKRHELFAEATGTRGAVAGRYQDHDTNGYTACKKHGVTIFEEQQPEEVARLINASSCVLNTSEYWGGGQRCTLEAMACGVPVIVMADSPKNREFVEESGGGLVVEPYKDTIQEAMKLLTPDMGKKGFEYIQSKWTEKHYAGALLEGIKTIV